MRKALLWLKQHMAQTGILLLITVALCCFVGQKQGYHMDELLSFQLSNARFNPWIVSTQPQGRLAKLYEEEILGEDISETAGNLFALVKDVLQNRGSSLVAAYKADVYEEPVWISREEFQDYITVGEGDAFFYPSVYFNVKDDNHPPLHFMLLHTVSSLFQGKVEPFMGCIINIAAILGCCALMMRLGEMYDKRAAGIAAALLYGLSSGAIASALLIRMYALMTFFCMAFFYQIMMKWQEKDFAHHNKWLITVTVLGFWTQYFFLFYCIGLAAAVMVLLLKKKDYRNLWGFVRSMLIAAGIGLLGFPFAISDVFSSGRGVEALNNLSEGLQGYGERLAAFAEILFTRVFGNVWFGLFAVLVCVFVAAGKRIVQRRRMAAVEDQVQEEPSEGCKRCNVHELCLLILPPLVYFLLAARMSPYLVDRYIMAVFPFAAMTVGLVSDHLLKSVSVRVAGRQILTAVVTAVICAVNLFTYDGEYLYKGYETQEQMSEEYADLACVCVCEGVGYYENLLEFTNYEKTILLTCEQLENRADRDTLIQEERIVVLIKQSAGAENTLRILEEQYGYYRVRDLVRESVYGDLVILCEVKH